MIINTHKAFTLAELLIALVILGVIATFTIPKVLTANQESSKKAIFKEDIATISQLVAELHMMQELASQPSSAYPAWMINKLNAVKICPNDASTEGCFQHVSDSGTVNADLDNPGVILHNGSAIVIAPATGLGNTAGHLVIDYNGAAGPNLNDKDILRFDYNTSLTNDPSWSRKGTIFPCGSSSSAYYDILK